MEEKNEMKKEEVEKSIEAKYNLFLATLSPEEMSKFKCQKELEEIENFRQTEDNLKNAIRNYNRLFPYGSRIKTIDVTYEESNPYHYNGLNIHIVSETKTR